MCPLHDEGCQATLPFQQRLFRMKAGNPKSMGTTAPGGPSPSLKPFPSPLGILFCELRIATLEEFAEPSYFKERS